MAMNLNQKLVSIRKQVEYIQKTETGNQGAKYVDPAVLLRLIRTKMDEVGVLLYPSISEPLVVSIDAPTSKNPNNKGFLSTQVVVYTWVDAETGEKLPVSWFATGQHLTDPAMAFGGAMTYSERYFLLKFFQIPTSKDDPEFFDQKSSQNGKVTEKQHSEMVDLVNSKGIDEAAFLAWINQNHGTNITGLGELPARLHSMALSTLKSYAVK